MIIVKSTFGKLELDNSALTSIQDTTDGIYARTKDGSEFRIASSPLPQLKVLSHMIMNMNSKDKPSRSQYGITPPASVRSTDPDANGRSTVLTFVFGIGMYIDVILSPKSVYVCFAIVLSRR